MSAHESVEEPIAVLFDGQGIFQPGMGKTVYDESRAAQEVFKKASRAVGVNMARVCFGDLVYLQEDPRIIQPAIITVGLAEYAAWREYEESLERRRKEHRKKRVVSYVTGMSLGIYAAMGATGVFESPADAVDAAARRARLMYEVAQKKPGKMAAAVGIAIDELEPLVQSVGAKIAVVTSRIRKIAVVTGGVDEMATAEEEARNKGISRWEYLRILGAFHHPLQDEAVRPFRAELDSFTLHDPVIELLGNNALRLATAEEAKEHALDQMTEKSDWDATNNALAQLGVSHVIEFGPDETRRLARQMVKTYGVTEIKFPQAV